jgi:hypothetical protein
VLGVQRMPSDWYFGRTDQSISGPPWTRADFRDGSFSTHLAEIEDWLMSAPVRKRRAKSGPGALRLAGLP